MKGFQLRFGLDDKKIKLLCDGQDFSAVLPILSLITKKVKTVYKVTQVAGGFAINFTHDTKAGWEFIDVLKQPPFEGNVLAIQNVEAMQQQWHQDFRIATRAGDKEKLALLNQWVVLIRAQVIQNLLGQAHIYFDINDKKIKLFCKAINLINIMPLLNLITKEVRTASKLTQVVGGFAINLVQEATAGWEFIRLLEQSPFNSLTSVIQNVEAMQQQWHQDFRIATRAGDKEKLALLNQWVVLIRAQVIRNLLGQAHIYFDINDKKIKLFCKAINLINIMPLLNLITKEVRTVSKLTQVAGGFAINLVQEATAGWEFIRLLGQSPFNSLTSVIQNVEAMQQQWHEDFQKADTDQTQESQKELELLAKWRPLLKIDLPQEKAKAPVKILITEVEPSEPQSSVETHLASAPESRKMSRLPLPLPFHSMSARQKKQSSEQYRCIRVTA